ncbi:MAG: MGMT family protein, partial [Victivallales bacterium]|nr:MGMT family protein [Victivallales bacterium]
DWSMLTEFQQTVLRCLREHVPAGKVITYSALASLAGRPGAARAVGGVMKANPFPVLIPCHRVVNADMSPGGFSGGLDVKIKLLASEGIIFDVNKSPLPQILDFDLCCCLFD